MNRVSIFVWWLVLIVAFGLYPAVSMCVMALLLAGAPLYGKLVHKMDSKVEPRTDLINGVSSFAALGSETVLSLIKAGIYKGEIVAPKYTVAERGGSHDDKKG
jgi:hypothetical protein